MNAAYSPDCRIWSVPRLVKSEIVAWHAVLSDQSIKFWSNGIFPKKRRLYTKDGWTDSRQFSSHVSYKFAIKARATAAVAWCDRSDHRLSCNSLQNKIHQKSIPSLRDKKNTMEKKCQFLQSVLTLVGCMIVACVEAKSGSAVTSSLVQNILAAADPKVRPDADDTTKPTLISIGFTLNSLEKIVSSHGDITRYSLPLICLLNGKNEQLFASRTKKTAS